MDDEFFRDYWDRTIGAKDDLENGIHELLDGSKELKDGLKELTDNNAGMKLGAQTVLESYISEANKSLSSYGFETLTTDNFEDVLKNHIDNESNAIMKLTLQNLLSDLKELKTYADGVREYTDGVKTAEEGAGELYDGIDELKTETDDIIDEIFNADAGNLLSFVKAGDNPRIQAASEI